MGFTPHKNCKLKTFGARGRTRTGTPIKAGDFKSPVSTNFTIQAKIFNDNALKQLYSLIFHILKPHGNQNLN